MKKYVFIDIDGTLFDHQHHEVPQSALAALKQAKENGHELFICTGRVKAMVESIYHALPVSGFVYGCGSHIEVHHEIIYQASFPKEEMKHLMDYFTEHRVGFSLEGAETSYFSEKTLKMYMSYFCGNNPEMEERFMGGKVIKKVSELDDAGCDQVLKMSFQADHMDDVRDALDNLSDKLTYFIYSGTFNDSVQGEILIKGSDKADSIDRVLQYFDGTIEDTIALGDSENDISMIQKAHCGVAMGNGCDALKAEADYITSAVYEDGLYQAFETLKLI